MDHDAGWLEIVAKDHKKWVSIVRSLGEHEYPEDIVQTSYEVLYKYATPDKIIKNGRVSQGYMFFTLRSVLYQYYNAKKKIQKLSIDADEFTYQIPDETDIEEQEGFHQLCMLIDEEIKNWRWYDRKLFEIYKNTDLSIRKIASQSKISWVSIYNTLKNSKAIIKEKFYEDYEDYKNRQFHLIQRTKGQKD